MRAKMLRVEYGFGVGFTYDGREIPQLDVRMRLIRDRIVDHFGGFTETAGTGGWRNGAGQDVLEPSRVIRVDMLPAVPEVDIRGIALYIKDVLEQEAVLYSITEIESATV